MQRAKNNQEIVEEEKWGGLHSLLKHCEAGVLKTVQ